MFRVLLLFLNSNQVWICVRHVVSQVSCSFFMNFKSSLNSICVLCPLDFFCVVSLFNFVFSSLWHWKFLVLLNVFSRLTWCGIPCLRLLILLFQLHHFWHFCWDNQHHCAYTTKQWHSLTASDFFVCVQLLHLTTVCFPELLFVISHETIRFLHISCALLSESGPSQVSSGIGIWQADSATATGQEEEEEEERPTLPWFRKAWDGEERGKEEREKNFFYFTVE